MKKTFTFLCFFAAINLYAQETPIEEQSKDLFDMSLEELLNVKVGKGVDKDFYLYGYINSNLQKTYGFPSLNSTNNTILSNDPFEWSPVHNFHIYGKGNLSTKIDYLFNLAANKEMIEVRNAWGNFVVREFLQVRVGKMYRKFGLYNERLDQIPTFVGVEPPEMLDPDHLFLPRTANLMIHGMVRHEDHEISYGLMTDNGENGPDVNLIPVGWDLRYKSSKNAIIFGISGYSSSVNGTNTTSTVALGSGSPKGGILPWMAGDNYVVNGVFIEKQFGKFLIQSEYYTAKHVAERDPAGTLKVIREAEINNTQRQRFLGESVSKDNSELNAADVQVKTSYNVQTWYVRLAYDIQTNVGQFVPYLFLDWMSHPENIRMKKFGGDNEAGLADDGKFFKPSLGAVYRPINNVAIKLDGSIHSQKFNGAQVSYPEVRLDFSFAFSNSFAKKL